MTPSGTHCDTRQQEPEDNFQGLQKFLYSVYFLLHEARLSRIMYVAAKK